ncbi:MAG: integrase arm-type DNA-binding domain-containing protein [Rhodospirillaceae bacterium]|nr:integrase arm-type DNA-binding domain-containing protein [Rhodospirillaceae bacterium]
MKFTDAYIRGIKPTDKRFVITEPGGLSVRVYPTGSKVFYYIYRDIFTNTKKYEKIGAVGITSLGDARKQCTALRNLRDQGVQIKKQAAGKAPSGATFGDLVEAYLTSLDERGASSAAGYRTAFTNSIYPLIPPRKLVTQVTPDDVAKVISQKIQKGALTQANRTRSMLAAAFAFGIKYDHDPKYYGRGAVFKIQTNPVEVIRKQTDGEEARNRVLSKHELKYHFENMPISGYGTIHRLMVLLGGQRYIDIASAKVADIDREKNVYDPSRASKKNQRVNVLPLSPWSLRIIDEWLRVRRSDSEYLFPARPDARPSKNSKPWLTVDGSARAKAALVKTDPAANIIDPYKIMDLRRTVKTFMGEADDALGDDYHITNENKDLLQNHNLAQNVSAKHYDRHNYIKPKRQTLETWEKFLTDIVKIKPW